ncbi:MAG: carbamoyltransferase [Patescibacteria group bacterium UBA2163]
MYTLGISAFYHDSAAALLKDGRVVAAFEEERFTRVKHDNTFPRHAIEACLALEGIEAKNLTAVTYYEKPLRKFERILDTIISSYPRSEKLFYTTLNEWLGNKLHVEKKFRDLFRYTGPFYFNTHHHSHAAAGFFSSSFNDAAVLTVDGVGEYTTTALWKGEGCNIECLNTISFPDSLGLLYSTFTAFLGFQVNNDEYKVMGLAAYGSPRYAAKIKEIIQTKPDGSFTLDQSFFLFNRSVDRLFSAAFVKKFGTPRTPGSPLTQRDKDMAASIQHVLEELYFSLINRAYELTQSPNLCISGGVALNALANGKILTHTPFTNIHIFGPAGDSGSAIGAAFATYATDHKKRPSPPLSLKLGSSYDETMLKPLLKEFEDSPKYTVTQYKKNNERDQRIAQLLNSDLVGALFVGRMEFGPRALGARSLIAKPTSQEMKDRMNQVKKRESFRPFGISMLFEEVPRFFTLPKDIIEAPYMNMCFNVQTEQKDSIAAVVHNDGSVRIQTVSQDTDPEYYQIISHFFKLSGVPGVLNTSLNIQGEPLAEHPEQAITLFKEQPVDFLVLENFLIEKINHGQHSQ